MCHLHHQNVWLLVWLLLAGSLRQAQCASGGDAHPTAEAGSDGKGTETGLVGDCPAGLILRLLEQLQTTPGKDSNKHLASGSAPQTQPFAWPPPALKQGLTCTMEVSQLSLSLPGSSTICTVLSIKNNLLSTLYSWQLVWQPGSAGVSATAATGAIMLNGTALGSTGNTVQLINPAANPNIAARGGSADVLVQLTLPRLAAPPTLQQPVQSPAVQSSSNTSTAPGPDGAQQPPAAAPINDTSSAAPAAPIGSVKPAIQAVFLNGLQCTRLPLARRPPPGLPAADGNSMEDCGTADWALDANGMLAAAAANSNTTSSPITWGSLNASITSSLSSNTSAALDSKTLDAFFAVLRQLSCVSQLCCGLQVVPSSVASTTSSGSDAANSTEPPVTALDGPRGRTDAVASKTQVVQPPSSSTAEPLPSDITPAPAPVATPSPQPPDSSSTVGLVVGLVLSSVMTGGLGAVVVVVLRQRRARRTLLTQHMKQQAGNEPGLVRHGSGASSNGSGAVSGATSLASLASAEWQQQQHHYTAVSSRPPVPWLRGGGQHVLPTYRTAPPHLLVAAATAAQADMPAGTVWRAGSWQSTDAYTPSGAQLLRTSTSPQPLVQPATATPGTQQDNNTAAPPLDGMHSSSSTLGAVPQPSIELSCPADHGPSGSALTPAVGGAGQGPVRSHHAVHESVPAGGSPTAGCPSGPSSLNSTWGSLKRFLGNNPGQGPQSSTIASGASSSVVWMRAGMGQHTLEVNLPVPQSPRPLAAALAVAPHREHLGQLAPYRPPLQLIQEAAPLSAAAAAAFPASVALSKQQLQLISAPGDNSRLAGASAEGAASVAVSRRISPIESVHDDTSSATSTDSLNPAAWHFTDRQLLEDTPGWLNIDFARDVRLEKKLGEGGFGQVFRARWGDEVVAAKLVPFMSLVAQHHGASISLVSAAAGAPDSAAAAAQVGASSSQQAGGTAIDQSHLSMRLGVQFSSASLRAIKVEIRVLSQISHPNIIAFKGACLAPPHICILEELADGGSLYSRLYSRSSAHKAHQQRQRQQQQQQHHQLSLQHGSSSSSSSPPLPLPRHRKAGPGGSSSGRGGMPPPPLSVQEVLHIAIDVSRAMVYLHALQPQVVHRDLKPQNVLLDLQGRAKVCDFGVSKIKDASLAASSTRLQAGTPAYMAPEQFEGCSVTDKVDVFAFGVLLWECFEQQQPWKELSPMQIIYSVGLQKERLHRPVRCPDELWQLIEACWAQDPRDRPSFAATLQALQQLQQQLCEQLPGGPQDDCGALQHPHPQLLHQSQPPEQHSLQPAQQQQQLLQQQQQQDDQQQQLQKQPPSPPQQHQLKRDQGHSKHLPTSLPSNQGLPTAGSTSTSTLQQGAPSQEDVDAHVAIVY